MNLFLDFSVILGTNSEAWAVLTDDVGSFEVDLMVESDITAHAGKSDVLLEFGVVDDDIIEPSSLTVSNIMFVQSGSMQPTSVPEPSTLLLFAVSLFAIVRKSRLSAK